MENSTKIYIGVGAAALIAFLLFRKKAVSQKPSIKTGGTAGGGTAGGSGSTSGGSTAGGTADGSTVPPVRGVDFPACPEGKIRFPNGECLPIDSEPPARTPPAPALDTAPDLRATPSPYRPNYTEYEVDNTYLRERDSYYKDIFQNRMGEYNARF